MPETPVTMIRPDQLSENAVIVDVRELDEWVAGHIDGAVHIPMGSVTHRMSMASEPNLLAATLW